MKTSVIKAGVIGGIVGIVLVLLSSLGACVGYLGYGVAIGVGVLAVDFSGQSLTASQGAVDGAIAGAIAGIINGVVGSIVGLLKMTAAASHLGVPIATGTSIVPVIVGGIVGVIVAVALGAVGGAAFAAVQEGS